MNHPAESPAIREAGRLIFERILAESNGSFLTLPCLTLNQASGIIGLSPENTAILAKKYGALVDFGRRAKRVSVGGLARMIEGETVKHLAKKGKKP